MLRTNLSTRPFYNERGVRTGLLALVGIGALALVSVEMLVGADAVGGLHGAWKSALGVFVTGCVIFMWGANVIIPIRPKK